MAYIPYPEGIMLGYLRLLFLLKKEKLSGSEWPGKIIEFTTHEFKKRLSKNNT